ncbi:MAG: NifB/NifX family molybdenum-iron cluster-binding protein [Sulfolobales archaeon]|jgi:predicted Fe-Mo cluster-binding NifX family protein
MIVAIPTERVGDSLQLSLHFGRAQYFTFVDVSNNSYKVLETVENPHRTHGHGEHGTLIELFKSRGVNAVVVGGIGPRALQDLIEVGIKVYYVPEDKGLELNDVVKALVNGELEEVSENYTMYRHHECEHHKH